MSEQEMQVIIGENLTRLLSERKMTQNDLAQAIGASPASVSYWCKGQKVPRADKLDAICGVLGCKRSDILMKPATSEADRLAEELKENAKYRILLSTARELSVADFNFLVEMAERLKNGHE